MMRRPTLCPPSAFPERVEAFKATGIAELSPIQTVTARAALGRLLALAGLPDTVTAKPVLIHAPNGRPYLAALLRREKSPYLVAMDDLTEHLPAIHRPDFHGRSVFTVQRLSPEAAPHFEQAIGAFQQGTKRSEYVWLGDAFVCELVYPAHLGDLAGW